MFRKVFGFFNALLKDKKPHAPNFPPEHPGIILKEFIMPNFKLTAEDVSAKSGINAEQLQSIFNGKADIDASTRNQLRKSFGAAADDLYNHQQTFDYYKEKGQWPKP